MDKKIVIIGIGNCGSQIANLANKKYPELFDTVYINTSESDLAMVADQTPLKFKIGKRDEVEGSGKNREKMKEYLKKDIGIILGNEELQNCIAEKKYAFICSSAAGGTGSGAAPVLFEVMRQIFPDTHFILITVLPQIKASLMEQGNCLDFLNELYDEDKLGTNTTYMIYDNETVADLPATEGLKVVNNEIVEDLKILAGLDNFPTPYESIDEADLESIITTPGRLLVARINKNLTEKVMEDASLDKMIVQGIKRSCHAETNRDNQVIRWGIITYFTEQVNALYKPDLEGLLKFLGEPAERFNHNAINPGNESYNFIDILASGLSPINDRITKIKNRIDELNQKLQQAAGMKCNINDGVSYDVMEARRKADKIANQPAEINPNDIFAKFMKK